MNNPSAGYILRDPTNAEFDFYTLDKTWEGCRQKSLQKFSKIELLNKEIVISIIQWTSEPPKAA